MIGINDQALPTSNPFSNSTSTQPSAAKRQRPTVDPNLSYAQAAAGPSNNELVRYFMEQNANLIMLMKEKDVQIKALNLIISNFQQEKNGIYAPMEETFFANANTKSGQYGFSQSVVITNLVEQAIETDNTKAEELDSNTVKDLVKNIDPSAAVVSIKRMGRKDPTRRRPIQVNLATKEDKINVLTKAPTYIKSNEALQQQKTFVNSMLSPDAHKMQMKLKKRLNEIRKRAMDANIAGKVFIKKNQIYYDDNINAAYVLQDEPVNVEAARFYSFRNERRRTTTQSTFMEQ